MAGNRVTIPRLLGVLRQPPRVARGLSYIVPKYRNHHRRGSGISSVALAIIARNAKADAGVAPYGCSRLRLFTSWIHSVTGFRLACESTGH